MKIFKPTKKKVIITLILFSLVSYYFYYSRFFHIDGAIFYKIVYLPVLLISYIDQWIPAHLNIVFKIIFLLAIIICEMIYIYAIVCLINTLINKIKK